MEKLCELDESARWRSGYDAGIRAAVTVLRRVLEGGDTGNGAHSNADLEKLRRDLMALKASEQYLVEKEAGENL
jgi:hypothetical protein